MQPCIIMMTSSHTFLGGVQCIRHVNANDIAYLTPYTSTPHPPASVEFLNVAKIIMEEEVILSMPSTIAEALDLYVILVSKIEQSSM